MSPGYPSGSQASVRSLLDAHALSDGSLLGSCWLYLSKHLLVVAVCLSRWKAETSAALSPSLWPIAGSVAMPDRSLIERLSRQFCPRMPLHALTSDLHLLIILRLPGFVLQLVRTVPLS